jgi:hypothetical protein
MAFKKESSALKKRKTELSHNDMADKSEVTRVEETFKYSKPIQQGLERILAKDWNIKWPSWHGGDILGNECQKLMAWTRLLFE